MNNFLQRTPFALLGAVGLLSLIQDLMQWQEHIGAWLDAWQAVTRPIWDFLLGWLFEWFGWEMPWWAKDYLTMGAIGSGARFRVGMAAGGSLFRSIPNALITFVSWPFWVAIAFRDLLTEHGDRESAAVFLESFLYALLIIAINYALIFGGSPAAG